MEVKGLAWVDLVSFSVFWDTGCGAVWFLLERIVILDCVGVSLADVGLEGRRLVVRKWWVSIMLVRRQKVLV